MKSKTFHFLTTTSATNSDQTNAPVREALPRTIVIGGQTLSVADTPELANLLELVRKDAATVEKLKLYPAIEKLKQEAAALANVQLTPSPTGNADLTGMEEMLTRIIDSRLTPILAGVQEQLSPLVQANKQSAAATLEAYRNDLLTANLGKCVPEMVVGNSREELDNALQASLASFDSLKGLFGVKSVEEQLANTQHTTPTDTIIPATAIVEVPAAQAPSLEQAAPQQQTVVLPSSPANSQIPSTELPNVASMSMEEFSKRREELAKNLANAV